MSKESLGLVSIRQVNIDVTGKRISQEISSYPVGYRTVDFPELKLSPIRETLLRLIGILDSMRKVHSEIMYEQRLNEAIYEAKIMDQDRGITYIEDWKNPASAKSVPKRL